MKRDGGRLQKQTKAVLQFLRENHPEYQESEFLVELGGIINKFYGGEAIEFSVGDIVENKNFHNHKTNLLMQTRKKIIDQDPRYKTFDSYMRGMYSRARVVDILQKSKKGAVLYTLEHPEGKFKETQDVDGKFLELARPEIEYVKFLFFDCNVGNIDLIGQWMGKEVKIPEIVVADSRYDRVLKNKVKSKSYCSQQES